MHVLLDYHARIGLLHVHVVPVFKLGAEPVKQIVHLFDINDKKYIGTVGLIHVHVLFVLL
jgi:hypothetical protein